MLSCQLFELHVGTELAFSLCTQTVHDAVIATMYDLQKSAVRLYRHRTLSPVQRLTHLCTHGSKETGRKTRVVTRHTLTQFGDWSGSNRPLFSARAQGTVICVPI